MENNTLQINLNNLTEEERTTLLSLMEKSNKPKNKIWKPNKGATYYFISNDTSICYTTWINCDIDEKRYSIGNCFKTEQEAKHELEKHKIHNELQQYALEHNKSDIDWNNDSFKYRLAYDHEKEEVFASCDSYVKNNSIYFTRRKTAEQAIQSIGEDRLKKYYFEVDEE